MRLVLLSYVCLNLSIGCLIDHLSIGDICLHDPVSQLLDLAQQACDFFEALGLHHFVWFGTFLVVVEVRY